VTSARIPGPGGDLPRGRAGGGVGRRRQRPPSLTYRRAVCRQPACRTPPACPGRAPGRARRGRPASRLFPVGASDGDATAGRQRLPGRVSQRRALCTAPGRVRVPVAARQTPGGLGAVGCQGASGRKGICQPSACVASEISGCNSGVPAQLPVERELPTAGKAPEYLDGPGEGAREDVRRVREDGRAD
jgi:hypothetical protein